MIKTTLEELKKHIIENKLTKKDKEIISSLFFSYDEKYPSDINYMIVFGNNNLHRIKQAVKLYKQKPCKMILSGGGILKNGNTESREFYYYAETNGVNIDDLICEEKSKNTIENIRYSLNLLPKNQETKLLIISSTQHLYRIEKTISLISKQLNLYPKCYYYPVYPKNYTKDKWYLYKNIRKDILSEIDKIIHYDLISK